MLKKILIIIFCIMILQACIATEKSPVVPPDDNSEQHTSTNETDITNLDRIPSVHLERSKFHSVIGWLSDEEILIVLVDKGEWILKSYSVTKEEWKEIYRTSTPVIQGMIHPSKEMIILHTSNNSSSAEVQLIHKNGVVEQSLYFESAELYMDWHPTDPNLIVFTAFYEDWSYNSMVYDGHTQELKAIDVENPFVKWLDHENLMVFNWSETSLDGSNLKHYSIADHSTTDTNWSNIIDVQNLGDSLVYIQIDEENMQFKYHLVNKSNGESVDWVSPAVSNYSEWVIPTISIISPNSFIAFQAKEKGNKDEANQKSIIGKYSIEGEEQYGEIKELPIDCSPNGKVCLGGYEKEQWINLNTLKEGKWLNILE
ncbi:MAG: hypothetical protein ABS934_07270 [Psychrobacillus sp.]